MAFYKYKVLAGADDPKIYSGVVYASDYADAAGKLQQEYGDDLVSIELLYETINIYVWEFEEDFA